MPKKSKFSLHLSCVDNGTISVFMVFDLLAKRLVPELTEFALDMAVRRQLSALTIKKRLLHAMRFWEFIADEGMPWQLVGASEIKIYRDYELPRVLLQAASLKHEMTAKRTVNDKLISIKSWLDWLSGSRPTVEPRVPSAFRYGRNKENIVGFPIQELLYRRVGSGSKHKVSYAVQDVELEALRLSLMGSSESPYVNQRNALIAEIANAVGLRRSSINSLVADQFNRETLTREARAFVLIRPLNQKFSYQNDFAFPVWLGLRICDFIDEHRAKLIAKKGASRQIHSGRLFLSSRDARPLTDRAISSIFAEQFKMLGAPNRVSVHALRAKFANDCIAEELENRLRRGMDTSTESIAVAVAIRMGHRSSKSLYAYVSRVQSHYGSEEGG